MTTLARQLRAARRESVAVVAVARLIGVARGAAATISTRPIARPADDDDAIRDSIAGSRAGRTVLTVSDSLESAWLDSTARSAILPLLRTVGGLTGKQRIRMAGLWMTIAAITDGVLALVDPRPASFVRWSLWATALVVGGAAALAASPLRAAWFEWRRAR